MGKKARRTTAGSDQKKAEPTEPRKPREFKISSAALHEAFRTLNVKVDRPPTTDELRRLFAPAIPLPGVLPEGKSPMAMDQVGPWFSGGVNPYASGGGAFGAWGGDSGMDIGDLVFRGYSILAAMAQKGEFHNITATTSGEMTRKWGKIKSADAAPGQAKKIKVLEEDFKQFQVRQRMKRLAELDGFFGRGHLYIDLGDVKPSELQTPIGDGKNDLSKVKCPPGALRRFHVVEPQWSYPALYNSSDPLAHNWYRPETWYVMGKEIHVSRFVPYVSREVPDLLKPAYQFGGLSLTQMAAPYVQRWSRSNTATSNLVWNFATKVLKTNLSTIFQGGSVESLTNRIQLYNQMQSNGGTFALDNDTEDFGVVSIPLGGLDHLRAQDQEHISSISQIPLVKWTGISPSGLNACVPGDTVILTERGQVEISNVVLSDRVMTRHGYAPLTFSGVTKYATELVEITTADTTLRCTANHPIWLTSINAFVAAGNVRRGDRLLLIGAKSATTDETRDVRERVISVGTVPASEYVYDLSVAPGYLPEFVANGILVHNSSEGEIQVWYDLIHAKQEWEMNEPVRRCLGFCQLNRFGEVDPDITFEWEPLKEESELEAAQRRLVEAQTHSVYVQMGAFDAAEIRKSECDDEESPYAGLDPNAVPQPPAMTGAPGQEQDGAPDALTHAAEMLLGGEGEGQDAYDPLDEAVSLLIAGAGGKKADPLGRASRMLLGQDAGFEEEDHPRDDEGKFSEVGGGSQGTKVSRAKHRPGIAERRANAVKAHLAAQTAERELRRRASLPKEIDRVAQENNVLKEVQSARAAAIEASGPVSEISSYNSKAPSVGKDQPAGVFMFKAQALEADAKRFQYKANADPEGVTHALKGVTKWDASKANQTITWEDASGKLFVVDGHQRVALAKRLLSQGYETKIELPGILFREKDGVQAADIRAIAAAKNIAEGSGSPIDGARILRSRPDLMDGSMPISRTEARQSFELAALNDEAFRMVVNDVVPYQQAAVVGRLIPNDAERQDAAMKALARFEPRNEIEATVLVQRVAQSELEKAEEGRQMSMFGDLESPESSAGEEMKIVAKAIQGLKNDTRLFSGVVKNADKIEKTGSTIARTGALAIKQDSDIFIERLSSEAYTAGPVRQTLVKSAKGLKSGAITIGTAVEDVLAALRGEAEKDVSDGVGDGRG